MINEEKSLDINIWDDYADDGSEEIQETYIYIEDDCTLENQKEILNGLMTLLNDNKLLPGYVDVWLEFFDAREKYPSLIGTQYEIGLFKQWRIRLKHITHEVREQLVEKLNQSAIVVNGYNLKVDSSS